MLKAEADNSYLDLDYSGLIEEVIVNNFMKFYKNCLLEKQLKYVLYKIVLYMMTTFNCTVTCSLGTEILTTFC